MDMFAIIYEPTGVPVGLYISKENAIRRCKHLSESRDFIVAKVVVELREKLKFIRDEDGKAS